MKELKLSMEIRTDGLVFFNKKGNLYDKRTGKQTNIYLGEIFINKKGIPEVIRK